MTNKGGRPRFDDDNPLTECVRVHVTKRDMSWMRERSAGGKLSALIRKLIRLGIEHWQAPNSQPPPPQEVMKETWITKKY